MGRAVGEAYPGLVVVGTVTADFAAEVISPGGSKIDRDKAGAKLEQGPRYQHLVPLVEEGMQMLELGCIPLNPPTDEDVRETMEKLRKIYSIALRLGRSSPSVPRAWSRLSEPDALQSPRLNQRMGPAQALPGLQPRNGRARISTTTYEENPDLERTSKDDADDSHSG